MKRERKGRGMVRIDDVEGEDEEEGCDAAGAAAAAVAMMGNASWPPRRDGLIVELEAGGLEVHGAS